MGRYISFGIVYRYLFEKQQIEHECQRRCWRRKEFKEMKEEIIRQLFPDIYDYEEDDKYISFTLSGSVKSEDLIECMKTYYSLVRISKEEAKELEDLYQQLEGKTIHEAYKYSEDKPSYLFQSEQLGYSYEYYAYPLVVGGEEFFCGVHTSIIMIDSSSAKTITEDDLLSYDFFTDLLRYRMQPIKLANSMIVFLSP